MKDRIALYVPKNCVEIDRRSSTGWGTCSLRLVVISDEERDGVRAQKIRNGINDWTEDLEFGAQWDLAQPRPEGYPRTYGWHCEYRRAFAVGLARATRMVKTLRRIERASTRLPLSPLTFGQWVVMMCGALGIKHVCTPLNDGGWDYDSTQHRVEEIAAAQDIVDAKIEPHLPREIETKCRTCGDALSTSAEESYGLCAKHI